MLLENDLNDLLVSFPTLPEGLLRACAVRGDVNAAKSWFSTLVSNGCLDDMEGSGSRLGQWINMDQLYHVIVWFSCEALWFPIFMDGYTLFHAKEIWQKIMRFFFHPLGDCPSKPGISLLTEVIHPVPSPTIAWLVPSYEQAVVFKRLFGLAGWCCLGIYWYKIQIR